MIDLIHISIPANINIRSDADITIYDTKKYNPRTSSSANYVTYLYKNSDGELVPGNKGVINDEIFTFTLYHKGGTININFPKISQFDINLHPIDKEEAENVVNLVQDRFLNKGIELDLRLSRLKYLEIYKNFTLDCPFHEYIKALEWLEVKRGIENKFDTTFYLGSGVRKLVIYDKTKELIDKHIIKDKTKSITGMIMRVEYRLSDNKTIFRELKLNTLGDLLKSWDKLNDKFNESVSKFIKLPNKEPPSKKLFFKSEAARLKHLFSNDNNRSAWNDYRKYWGSVAIMNHWESVQDLRSILSSYKSSDAVSRHIKELREDAMKLPTPDNISLLHLLQEFHAKLLS